MLFISLLTYSWSLNVSPGPFVERCFSSLRQKGSEQPSARLLEAKLEFRRQHCCKKTHLATAVNASSTLRPDRALVSMKGTPNSCKKPEMDTVSSLTVLPSLWQIVKYKSIARANSEPWVKRELWRETSRSALKDLVQKVMDVFPSFPSSRGGFSRPAVMMSDFSPLLRRVGP